MKLRVACVLIGFLSLSLSLAQLTVAQTAAETASALPRLVRFGGTVKDLNGNLLTGVVGITFALYSEQTGGAALWLETQNVTADSNGHYVALLGSTKPDGLPVDLFTTEQARWVGVQVSGQAEQPRVLLVSAPYALKAGDAETLGGKPASAYALATPQTATSAPASESAKPSAAVNASTNNQNSIQAAIAGSGTKNYIPLWTSSTTLGNSNIFQNATNKDIGIGTTTPAAALDVKGTVNASTSFNLGGQAFAFGSYSKANAFLGFSANSTTTGTDNTASGVQALHSNTTGSDNTASGSYALASNTTGTENTASGSSALTSNTTGPYNTASGLQALFSNTTGSFNTASGLGALFSNTSASYNTASGSQSLYSNSTGSYNTASGFQALYSNTNNYNVADGYQALYNNTTGSLNTGSGSYSLFSNTTGSDNTGSGNGTLYANTTGTQNTATGVAALYHNTTGSYNTASGYQALYFNNPTNSINGNYNTASGFQALYANTTGSSNTASGVEALNNNTTGTQNTASGAAALFSNTTAGSNTASGASALYYNTTGGGNTAIGGSALQSNTTGGSNTASGVDALYTNSTGSNNTALGYHALYTNSTGSNNTALGYGAGPSSHSITLNYATAIGAGALVSLSNALVLGGPLGSGTNVSVGIGTAAPMNVFTIAQNAGVAISDGWTTYSSRRWKTNIHPLSDALSKVEQLRGVSYDLKDSGKHEIGVIAEEVGQVVPEVVSYEKNGKDATGVEYSRLTALLIEATKEQQREIQHQQAALRTQAAAIRDLKSELRATRQTLQKVKAQVAVAQPALVATK